MTSNQNGVIYVLTDPAFPEYVRTGYADNIEKRLSEFNRSECLPFAFRAYCVYEARRKKYKLAKMVLEE